MRVPTFGPCRAPALFLACALLINSCPNAWSQAPVGSSYTQTFDSLASSGNNNPWTDNTSLVGWYSTRTVYQASDGTGNTGDLYSFGTVGSSERALGSINSGSTGVIQYGVQLQNTSGAVVTAVTVSYTGEQWRNGGAIASTDSLVFDYLLTPSGANQLTAGGYTPVPSLNFTNLVSSNPAGPLDGNAAANRQTLSETINLTWQPGEYLWLRWTDSPKQGNDHGLGIDDLSLIAVPEPGTYVLIGLSAAAGVAMWRRARRKARAVLEGDIGEPQPV